MGREQMQQARYGIYVDDSGLLATSICHAKDGNAGKGECRHFSFSDTAEEADRKLSSYLSDRMEGDLDADQVDGTAGDFLNAFRNWLILEKGFNADDLPRPEEGQSLLTAWFDGDSDRYARIIGEARETSLLAPMFAGAEQKDSVKRIADSGIPIRVISNPTLDDAAPERVESDTAMWMEMNGIPRREQAVEGGSEVSVISSGDARHDIKEIISHGDRYVKPAGEGGHPDERRLDDRYVSEDASEPLT